MKGSDGAEEDEQDLRTESEDLAECKNNVLNRRLCYLAVLIVLVGVVWACVGGHEGGSEGGNVITITTHFTPVPPSAFTAFLDSEVSSSSLRGVLGWHAAAVSWAWVPAGAFMALAPPPHAPPGHVWRLIHDTQHQLLYSNRYVPPAPDGPVEELLFKLLSMFHPQPFLLSRYGPRGAVAVVRARTSDTVQVLFRVHAEYQLNTPPALPLWFTPAALLGSITLNTSSRAPTHFAMHVPAHRRLNVDLEWLVGPDEDRDMEVTITHLAAMSLAAPGTQPHPGPWDHEVTQDTAMDLLQKEMYRYQQVEYHNLSTGVAEAASRGRPLHTLVLWGALADQSC